MTSGIISIFSEWLQTYKIVGPMQRQIVGELTYPDIRNSLGVLPVHLLNAREKAL